MEGLIAIAIIWFVFSRLKKSTGKNAQPAKKPVAPPPMQQAQGGSRRDRKDRMGGPLPLDGHEGSSYRDEQGCIGGSLTHDGHEGTGQWDEQGCIGGSLTHDTHEGSTVRTQVRPVPTETPVPRPKASALTPTGMRSAVIMAEILSRPVSMRRNGRTIR